MRGLGTVFRKEVRENLRDRRTVFNSLLLGPLLFPLVFIALIWFTTSAQQERAEKTLEVPVVGAEHAPSLMRFLEQQGMVAKPAPEDPEEVVRQQQEMVVLRIRESFVEAWKRGEPAPVEVIHDPSRQESDVPVRRLKTLLAAYGQQIGALRLHLRGVDPRVSMAVMIRDVDLSTAQSRAILAMIFLPYVLMLAAASFVYVALADLVPDLHRSERHRGHWLSQFLLMLVGVAIIALVTGNLHAHGH